MDKISSFHELKQVLIRGYNTVNQGMYQIGVSAHRIEVLGDKILIFAQHKRIPAMKVLDEEHPLLSATVDTALIASNKRRIAETFEDILGIPIKTVLKDYDPKTELAVTVIVLERELR